VQRWSIEGLISDPCATNGRRVVIQQTSTAPRGGAERSAGSRRARSRSAEIGPGAEGTSRLGPGGVLGCLLGGGLLVGAGASLGIAAGLAALAATCVVLVVLWRPAAGALLLVTLVPVTSGLRRGLPVPGLRLSEALIASVAVVLLATAPAGRSARWRLFDWLALTYVVVHAGLGIVDTMARNLPLDFATLSEVAGPLQFFLLYRAVLIALPTDENRRRAMRLILFAAIPVALVAVLQEVGVTGVRQLLSALTTEGGKDRFAESLQGGVPRATGPFASWHALGGYLSLVLLLATGLLIEGSWSVLSRRALIAVIAAGSVGIAVTASAAPIFAAAGGAAALGWWSGRLKSTVGALLAVTTVVAILFGSLFTERYDQQYRTSAAHGYLPQTLAFRYDVWVQQYLPVLDGHWLTGYGTDLPPNATWQSTESIYLTMLLRGGIPLLATYAALMGFLVVEAMHATRGPPSERRALARVVVVAVIALATIQVIIPLFIGAGVPHLFWVLLALIFGSGSSPERPLTVARAGGCARKAAPKPLFG
jgi:hypothetical protein